MPEKKSIQNLVASAARLRLSRLLMAAALIHIIFVIALNVVGHYQLLPNTFDQNGIGISFAVDSSEYRTYIINILKVLKNEGVLAWVKDGTPFHVKLYSICYALLGKWLGYTTLAAEPLNLIYYLSIVLLVFQLGREVFDRRVGIVTACLVAIWPSLLLHTTQLLRDPLFISMVLAFLYVCAIFLKRDCSFRKGLMLAICAGVAANIIWLIRSQMWEVLIATTLLVLCLILVKHLRQRRVAASNLVSCCLLFLFVLSLPLLGSRLNLYSYPANPVTVTVEGQNEKEVVYVRRLPPGANLPQRISYLRSGFLVSYPTAGSNIDRDVHFSSFKDILLYLPRAAAIGFFSPFPNMWFVEGPQVGLVGRLLSGFETLLMYVMELFAAFCLWRFRRQLAAWLLFATAAVGVIALGLVVANIATLYRMRYAFWILLLILGVRGALLFFSNGAELEEHLEA